MAAESLGLKEAHFLDLIDGEVDKTDPTWVTATPEMLNNLAVGQHASVELDGLIPADALIGLLQQVVVKVSSLHDPAVARQFALWIRVTDPAKNPVFIPILFK